MGRSTIEISPVTDASGARGSDPEALATIFVADIVFDPIDGAPILASALTAVAQGEQFGYTDIRTLDWSPDGQAIVFGLQPNPGVASLKIVDWISGSPITRMLANDAYHPTWSPNGSRIAFKPFNQGVHLINPDGSGLTRLTRNSWDSPMDWSPDGSQVVFSRGALDNRGGQGEISDVLRIPAAGGKEVNLTSDIDGRARPLSWR